MLVSGGGWGVGDIEGAVAESLAVDGATVVCLTGRNEALRAAIARRFADDPRVRVEGFTEHMADWLAAGDVLVHSTGGLTVLEAILRGCPVISFGWGRGHIRKHNEAFRRFGLAEVVETRADLQQALGARPRRRSHGDRRFRRAAVRRVVRPGGRRCALSASRSPRSPPGAPRRRRRWCLRLPG